MARDLTATMATEAAAATKRPVFFYEGEFTSGFLRLCSLPYDISWNSLTWTGAGSLLGVSPMQESVETRELQTTVSLQCSSAIAALALAQSRTGYSGKVWWGTLDSSGAVNADPFLAFEGRLDKPNIALGGDRAVVSITYGSRIRDLERPRVERLTHEEQQRRFANDDGLEFVAEVARVLTW